MRRLIPLMCVGKIWTCWHVISTKNPLSKIMTQLHIITSSNLSRGEADNCFSIIMTYSRGVRPGPLILVCVSEHASGHLIVSFTAQSAAQSQKASGAGQQPWLLFPGNITYLEGTGKALNYWTGKLEVGPVWLSASHHHLT